MTLPSGLTAGKMALIGPTLDKEVAAGRVKITGDEEKGADLLGLLVTFDPLSNIVTP